jgi:16S rRNA (cytosine967-C5)-methyltransferase
MKRLGVSIVTTCHHDLSTPPDLPQAAFDRILLDAPCSGLGVLRRNPDAKWRAQKKDIDRLRDIQLSLLASLARLLKPSGTLLYVVCSTEPEENESVIERFLESRPDFRVDPLSPSDIVPGESITDTGFFRTYPSCLSMDGFFAARLKKTP